MSSRQSLPILLFTLGALAPLTAQTGKLSVRTELVEGSRRFIAAASLEGMSEGRVAFFDGVAPTGTAAIAADGTAAWPLRQLLPGAHTLRAVV